MTTATVNIQSIVITRGEGPTRECGIPHTVTTWAEADRVLARMAITAPKSGMLLILFHSMLV